MRIFITGASGFIGTHLTRSHCANGHQVTACVRGGNHSRYNHIGVVTKHLDFTQSIAPSDWLPHLDNIDVVINAVGIIEQTRKQSFDLIHNQTPCALFQACELAGVKRVIQISALGADDTAFSQYHLSKKAADDYLQQLDLDWIIVKPSIVYGAGSSSMNFFKAIANLPLIPVIGGGDQQIQPIHISDFARAIERLIQPETSGKIIVDMVGPEPITIKQLYSDLHTWLGKGRARFLSIPYPLVLFTAHVFGPLLQAPITPDAIKMLNKGNIADVKPFINKFGFRPKSFDQVFAETPAHQADRWHAGLYFLAPLLRFSIAFLWIYTGIVSAFVYPAEQSYKMLADAGVSETWRPLMLHAASLLNISLGIMTLISYRLVLLGLVQITLIIFYSIIISIALPEQWFHPFGPVSKNIPIIVSILIMIVLSRHKR